jgi:hypothetical protein
MANHCFPTAVCNAALDEFLITGAPRRRIRAIARHHVQPAAHSERNSDLPLVSCVVHAQIRPPRKTVLRGVVIIEKEADRFVDRASRANHQSVVGPDDLPPVRGGTRPRLP